MYFILRRRGTNFSRRLAFTALKKYMSESTHFHCLLHWQCGFQPLRIEISSIEHHDIFSKFTISFNHSITFSSCFSVKKNDGALSVKRKPRKW